MELCNGPCCTKIGESLKALIRESTRECINDETVKELIRKSVTLSINQDESTITDTQLSCNRIFSTEETKSENPANICGKCFLSTHYSEENKSIKARVKESIEERARGSQYQAIEAKPQNTIKAVEKSTENNPRHKKSKGFSSKLDKLGKLEKITNPQGHGGCNSTYCNRQIKSMITAVKDTDESEKVLINNEKEKKYTDSDEHCCCCICFSEKRQSASAAVKEEVEESKRVLANVKKSEKFSIPGGRCSVCFTKKLKSMSPSMKESKAESRKVSVNEEKIRMHTISDSCCISLNCPWHNKVKKSVEPSPKSTNHSNPCSIEGKLMNPDQEWNIEKPIQAPANQSIGEQTDGFMEQSDTISTLAKDSTNVSQKHSTKDSIGDLLKPPVVATKSPTDSNQKSIDESTKRSVNKSIQKSTKSSMTLMERSTTYPIDELEESTRSMQVSTNPVNCCCNFACCCEILDSMKESNVNECREYSAPCYIKIKRTIKDSIKEAIEEVRKESLNVETPEKYKNADCQCSQLSSKRPFKKNTFTMQEECEEVISEHFQNEQENKSVFKRDDSCDLQAFLPQLNSKKRKTTSRSSPLPPSGPPPLPVPVVTNEDLEIINEYFRNRKGSSSFSSNKSKNSKFKYHFLMKDVPCGPSDERNKQSLKTGYGSSDYHFLMLDAQTSSDATRKKKKCPPLDDYHKLLACQQEQQEQKGMIQASIDQKEPIIIENRDRIETIEQFDQRLSERPPLDLATEEEKEVHVTDMGITKRSLTANLDTYDSLEKMVTTNLKHNEIRRSAQKEPISVFEEIVKEEKSKMGRNSNAASAATSRRSRGTYGSKVRGRGSSRFFDFFRGWMTNKAELKQRHKFKPSRSIMIQENEDLVTDTPSESSDEEDRERARGKRTSMNSYKERIYPTNQ